MAVPAWGTLGRLDAPRKGSVLTDGLGRAYKVESSTIDGLPALSFYDGRGNAVISWAAGVCQGSYELAKSACPASSSLDTFPPK